MIPKGGQMLMVRTCRHAVDVPETGCPTVIRSGEAGLGYDLRLDGPNGRPDADAFGSGESKMMTLHETLVACSEPIFRFPSSFRLQDRVYGGILAVAVYRLESAAKNPPVDSDQFRGPGLARYPYSIRVDAHAQGVEYETHVMHSSRGRAASRTALPLASQTDHG